MVRILRLLTALLVLSAAPFAWAGFIRGQVRYANGKFADRVVVRLRSDRIAFQTETQTDPEGKFNFDGLDLSTYHLTIEGQGFRPYEKVIDISMSKMSYELITLQLDKQPEPNAVPPEGPGGSVSAQEENIPADARKEFEAAKRLLHEKKDAEGSLKRLRKAIELYGNYSEAYLLQGLIYLDLRKLDLAQSSLQKANELDPAASGAYFALGTLFNLSKNYADAEKVLTHGLELKPDVADGQYELAKTYWALGRWQESEPHAQKAVSLAPTMASPHVLLGNIALRKQDVAAARTEFQEYLRLDPSGPMAAGVTQMLSKLEKSEKK